MNLSDWIIGIDLGDKASVSFAIDRATGEVREGRFAMTEVSLKEHLASFGSGRVVFEVGAQSRWVKRAVESMDFEAQAVDPRKLALISRSIRKNDRNDARSLAQLAATGFGLLSPVEHRSDEQQADLAVTQARDALVSSRTTLITMVRSMVKSFGARMPSCDAASFHRRREVLPEILEPALGPIFDQIEILTRQIRAYDREIERICAARYPETSLLTKVRGVGSLTALVFVLTLADPRRFKRSRDAAAYLGLCPRQHESGALRKELGITKAGDGFTRRLLVQAAHYILGPFGEDCDLRRFGERLIARGGKAAKKRAAVAVARKLAVLLHRLWADSSRYEALRHRACQAA